MCLIYKVKSPVVPNSDLSNIEAETPPSSDEALVPSQTATTVLSAQLEVEKESLLNQQGSEFESSRQNPN